MSHRCGKFFSDKQARGAFGQERMEAIVSDQLSPDQYEFQASPSMATVRGRTAPIRIPNVAARIVVDARTSWKPSKRCAWPITDEERKSAYRAAAHRHGQTCEGHRGKISHPGRNPDPRHPVRCRPRSIYAELHHQFRRIAATGAPGMQVVVVSPHVFHAGGGHDPGPDARRPDARTGACHPTGGGPRCCRPTSNAWASAWAICSKPFRHHQQGWKRTSRIDRVS